MSSLDWGSCLLQWLQTTSHNDSHRYCCHSRHHRLCIYFLFLTTTDKFWTSLFHASLQTLSDWLTIVAIAGASLAHCSSSVPLRAPDNNWNWFCSNTTTCDQYPHNVSNGRQFLEDQILISPQVYAAAKLLQTVAELIVCLAQRPGQNSLLWHHGLEYKVNALLGDKSPSKRIIPSAEKVGRVFISLRSRQMVVIASTSPQIVERGLSLRGLCSSSFQFDPVFHLWA